MAPFENLAEKHFNNMENSWKWKILFITIGTILFPVILVFAIAMPFISLVLAIVAPILVGVAYLFYGIYKLLAYSAKKVWSWIKGMLKKDSKKEKPATAAA